MSRHTAVLLLEVEINFDPADQPGTDPKLAASRLGHDLLVTVREYTRSSEGQIRLGHHGVRVVRDLRPETEDRFL